MTPGTRDGAVTLGISACLLGVNVRYDGTNKYHEFIAEILGKHLRLEPICPEAGAGLGVPRPPVHLVVKNHRIHAVGVQDPDLDVTSRLERFALQQTAIIRTFSGYIFKSRSPSCGVSDTSILTESGAIPGSGILAHQITHALPYLPVIDEICLEADSTRDQFLEQVFALSRWQAFAGTPMSIDGFRQFHESHAFVLSQHDARLSRELAAIVAEAGNSVTRESVDRYLYGFMACLQKPLGRDGHGELLEKLHLRLCRLISREECTALGSLISGCMDGRETLEAVCAAIRMLADRYGMRDICAISWLTPSPAETALRYRRTLAAPF